MAFAVTASSAGVKTPAECKPGGRAKISVIIPALNEAGTISATLRSLQNASDVEIVVVDGGSSDDTADLARSWEGRVLASAPGRARQMNRGAAAATGHVLLFLHADTRLPEGFEDYVRQALSQPHIVAGAFELRIDGSRSGLRTIEHLANWRARHLGMPYGDQAIFLPAHRFRALGGFADLPIMEDFELMRRLRRQGRIAIVPAPVVTSARRWLELGVWKTTLVNQVAIAAYCVGLRPAWIAAWYHSRGKKPRIGQRSDTEERVVSGLRV